MFFLADYQPIAEDDNNNFISLRLNNKDHQAVKRLILSTLISTLSSIIPAIFLRIDNPDSKNVIKVDLPFHGPIFAVFISPN